MNKTLLRTFEPAGKHAAVRKTDKVLKMENAMMNNIKTLWHEAAKDLLQPRPQVVADLLRKIHS